MADSIEIDAQRASPLAHLADEVGLVGLSADGLEIREAPFQGKVRLAVTRGAAANAGQLGEVLGIALPTTPNKVSSTDKLTALWLSPREWLIFLPLDRIGGFVSALASIGSGADAVDMSDGLNVFDVEGPAAADFLATGCPLDLHESGFPTGTSARTLVAKSSVVVWRPNAHTFRVIVDRSLSRYFWSWVQTTLPEFQTD